MAPSKCKTGKAKVKEVPKASAEPRKRKEEPQASKQTIKKRAKADGIVTKNAKLEQIEQNDVDVEMGAEQRSIEVGSDDDDGPAYKGGADDGDDDEDEEDAGLDEGGDEADGEEQDGEGEHGDGDGGDDTEKVVVYQCSSWRTTEHVLEGGWEQV